jgi:hypothetical protein
MKLLLACFEPPRLPSSIIPWHMQGSLLLDQGFAIEQSADQ